MLKAYYRFAVLALSPRHSLRVPQTQEARYCLTGGSALFAVSKQNRDEARAALAEAEESVFHLNRALSDDEASLIAAREHREVTTGEFGLAARVHPTSLRASALAQHKVTLTRSANRGRLASRHDVSISIRPVLHEKRSSVMDPPPGADVGLP